MSEKNSSTFLYLAVFCVNLYTFCTCNAYTWSSPSLPILHSNNTDINPLRRPITNLEESWILSLQLLGSVVGTLLSGLFSKKFGSKKSLIIASVPFIIGYIIIAHSKSIVLFYIARFLTGISAIFSMGLIPSYVAEISQDHNRGILSSLTGTTICLSNLMNYGIGPLLSIQTMAYIGLSIMVIFLITFVPFVPESPYRYMQIQKNERAEKCLKKFRGNSDVKNEMENVYNLLSHERVENQNIFKDIVTSSSTKRALIICCTLILCQIFMGYSFLAVYLQTVIEATDDTIPYYAVTMTVGVLQTFSGILCGSLVDKLGRKILMYISAVGCSVSMFSLSIYFFLKIREYNIDSMFWLPLVTLSMFFVFFCLGMGIIPIILTGELYSPNVKSVCLSITFMFSMGSAFLYTAAIPFVLNIFGIDVMFCVCGIVSILAVIFLKIFVPETKGRSFEEIQILLGSKK
ncbi:unnamed protein product [Psylliodes chrysocephalus]|uniref:Major facilitator superfamily (MFS) profile domain-containing protein n=1 Tax=Psylliodes chrysocephalus TaxID=3402493 RepID=A0A9P0CXM0_9CUCU|nr:unnamed protein product [Psylliodes chrysocephala]